MLEKKKNKKKQKQTESKWTSDASSFNIMSQNMRRDTLWKCFLSSSARLTGDNTSTITDVF